jgi:hypothetical protein
VIGVITSNHADQRAAPVPRFFRIFGEHTLSPNKGRGGEEGVSKGRGEEREE